MSDLKSRADLTQYGYPRFASDLEQVRLALGYDRLNLFGGSYGTRAEQVYIRAYPANVRTAFFGSPVPIDIASPLPMAKTAQVALEDMFDACAAEALCHQAFPDVRNEFAAVLARLDAGSVSVSLAGTQGPFLLKRGPVAAWVRSRLYRPSSAAELPLAIHSAFLGDWRPIVSAIESGDDKTFSFGLFFAITCSEDVPFAREEDISRQSRGTFLGEYRIRQQQAACQYWPRSRVSSEYRLPVHASAPSVFVTGAADGGTPVWFSQHVAAGFPNRVTVLVGGLGHTEWNGCVAGLYARLVREGSAANLRKECPTTPRPPFTISG